MDEWKLADAKNRLSEVIERAAADGAQVITRHGKKVAYIVSTVEFERLKKSGRTLADVMADAPEDEEFARIMDEIVASRPTSYDKPSPFEDD